MSVHYCPYLFDSNHEESKCEECSGKDLVPVEDTFLIKQFLKE